MAEPVVFYTRPRCPYSFRLRRALRRRRLAFREVNIWEDPAAAAAVRLAAGGNETVPTIEVAGRWLVNPTADEVCAAAGHRPGQSELSRRGGSGIEVTMTIYAHTAREEQRKALAGLGERLQ